MWAREASAHKRLMAKVAAGWEQQQQQGAERLATAKVRRRASMDSIYSCRPPRRM